MTTACKCVTVPRHEASLHGVPQTHNKEGEVSSNPSFEAKLDEIQALGINTVEYVHSGILVQLVL